MWNCSYIAAQHTATVGTCTAHWLYRCKYFCSTHANAFIKRDHATKHHWHRVNITLYQKFIHIWLQFGNRPSARLPVLFDSHYKFWWTEHHIQCLPMIIWYHNHYTTEQWDYHIHQFWFMPASTLLIAIVSPQNSEMHVVRRGELKVTFGYIKLAYCHFSTIY